PLDVVREQGWLLGPFPQGELWQPLTFSQFQAVNWWVIIKQSGTIATLMFISLLSLVLTNNGIELAVEKEIDLNNELQAVGLANIAAGIGSGMAGNQALPSTLLVHKMGANYRLAGVFKLIPCLLVLVLGSEFLAYFPKPILGCLLLYLGIDLLVQWLYKAAFKLPLTDYLTVWLILVVINSVGFLQGVLVGLGMSVLLFVVNYSRVNVTKDEFSGAACQSDLERNPQQLKILQQSGNKIYVLQLQGFIFFGTANKLLEQVRDRITQLKPNSLQYIIIDFHLVSGIDSSAVLNFSKIKKLAEQHNITLVYIGITDKMNQFLKRGEAIDSPEIQFFSTLNEGLAWCEDNILQSQVVIGNG
ncbi:MAG: SulP family inorganic anion transporter, partial [Kamptonema sp. SIO4C4]|nr:SulP family inorganic anion transporter [Kamptonema sp. SIO4C4]